MKMNAKGIDLIKHFESLHDGDLTRIGLQPKMCPAGIWTVGYGHALTHPTEKRFLKGAVDRDTAFKINPVATEQQAADLLARDLQSYGATVLKMIRRRDLTEDQFSALVSFCYNCGTHYTDKGGKKQPFALWANIDNRLPADALRVYWDSSVIRGGGVVLPGLQRRRRAEAHLYLTGKLKFQW